MSHSNAGMLLLNLLKTICVAILRLAGLAVMLSCRLLSKLFDIAADLLSKLIGQGH